MSKKKKLSRAQEERIQIQSLARDRERRITLLLDLGIIQHRAQIPDDAIPVDAGTSTKANVWGPEFYYRDIAFTCKDCRSSEVWSALSQQRYFETRQASPYKLPTRCYGCRQKELQRKNEARRRAGHDDSRKTA